jgi:hypothetical protein
MLAEGIEPGVWFTDSHLLALCPPSASFVIGEVEGASDYEGVVANIPHLDEGMPRAIVTTYDGLLVKKPNGETDKAESQARCKPLVDAGFFVQYEAYFYTEPDNTDANHCGWPSHMVAPVIGVGFNGKSLEQQKALQVDGYGVYLAEYLTP